MRRTLVLVFALACSAALLTPAPATAQSAASLRSQLENAGSRMEKAAENYNAARIRRQKLDAKVGAAKAEVAQSERKLASVRKRLGDAVRYMYKHPAGGMSSIYQARSMSELGRGNAMAGRVVLSTDQALLEVRKARAEERAAVSNLENLRAEARRNERAMAAERRSASAYFAQTQQLLRDRQLSDSLEAERLAGLRSAGSIAAQSIKFAGPVSPKARIAVQTALAQQGKPYRWGAAGPDSFDCSGLMMYAWGRAGVGMSHYTGAQWNEFPRVPLDQLAPGDIVFYYGDLHHNGMYIGNGQMVHAPHTGDVVKTTSIYRMGGSPVGAVRPG